MTATLRAAAWSPLDGVESAWARGSDETENTGGSAAEGFASARVEDGDAAALATVVAIGGVAEVTGSGGGSAIAKALGADPKWNTRAMNA
jgi:hypothetical protein